MNSGDLVILCLKDREGEKINFTEVNRNPRTEARIDSWFSSTFKENRNYSYYMEQESNANQQY